MQQDPRASVSAQSVLSERASISSTRNSFAPPSARSTRQSYLPANSKGGAASVRHMDALLCQNIHLSKLLSCQSEEDLQGYSLQSRWDVQPSMGGSEGAASQPADPMKMPSSGENANTIVGSLDIMWQWAHQLTQGLSVTSMSWNKVNKSILAVGYGQLAFGPPQKGCVCIWSLKNPSSPLWAFATSFGVTALDWATNSPNLLALGFNNGTMAMHDARTCQVEPLMQTGHSSGAHRDPVWQLQWVDRGAEAEEVLVSVSTDGRVCLWSTSQGLKHVDLLVLKRALHRKDAAGMQSNAASPSKSESALVEPIISRRSGAFCFAFANSGRSQEYLVGTEEGAIHLCSTTMTDHYMKTYTSHHGPVYAVRWHPSSTDIFLSASADCTARLWSRDHEVALFTFQTGFDEVSDVRWWPGNPTAFVMVNSRGCIEVWDVARAVDRPRLAHSVPDNIALTHVTFAPGLPLLVCGHSNGLLTVLRHHDIGLEQDLTVEEQRARLASALHTSNTVPGA
ncbi:hypothetical protein WJX75_006207 [Coccomyxa subellipsoidea]|uniref:Dynein axonemal intermediate chain 4 n=1 Tax=Coccomyxa subellipsoidea TaxID=248742 RepID=A0ABR2YUJ7_9CHLO